MNSFLKQTLAVTLGIILAACLLVVGCSILMSKAIVDSVRPEKDEVQDAKDAIQNAKDKKIQDARDALFEEYYNLRDERYEYEVIDRRGSWLAPGSPGGPGTEKRARYEELRKLQ